MILALNMAFGIFTRRRRDRLRAKAVPDAWPAILERNLSIFLRLPPEDRSELLGHMQVFLEEKHFEGCGGLQLTEEIQVTIAAQACVLLLHRETDYYPQLVTILVYPSGYTASEERHVGGGIWAEGDEDRLGHTTPGMSALVLAWDAARHGAADPDSGDNLILHEFAHQLDFENQVVDGTPVLGTHGEYVAWARIMSAEFEALRNANSADLPTFLDGYGATSPAEFFAVTTESFFEKPRALRRTHPALYAELERFYRQDPVSYSAEPAID